ncbi:hypothetical protein CTEN210_11748 [Chaetoceros tenuissimus]|uniref:DUF1279 domain-containing protein n=1 Tax=Chaetoceros tenuissimus TaxID=426638 RepID=A0AAD3CZV9_9STRA|nr:hypothetical protein CTEN210_11748 [Chaetoceros tenuissimus]
MNAFTSMSRKRAASLFQNIHSRNHQWKKSLHQQSYAFHTLPLNFQKKEENKYSNTRKVIHLQSLSLSTIPKQDNNKTKMQKSKVAMKKAGTSVKDMMQTYGSTFITTYLSVYVGTLGIMYLGLDTGLIDPISITQFELPWHTHTITDDGELCMEDTENVDSAALFVANFMKQFPWTAPYADLVISKPNLAKLGLAWVATKFSEPIRLPIAIAITRQIKKDVVVDGSVEEDSSDGGSSDVDSVEKDTLEKKTVNSSKKES